MSEDPLESRLEPYIELVDTFESDLMDPILWDVHGAAGIPRDHIHPSACKYTEARIRYWHPPLPWKGEWQPPLKLPPVKPYYKNTLVKWCPPMWSRRVSWQYGGRLGTDTGVNQILLPHCHPEIWRLQQHQGQKLPIQGNSHLRVT